MESNYRNSEFEQFVKENADQYRMFPSEKVWKGINSTLHTRRKWYGFGLALLLLMTGTAVTWVMVSYPVSKNQKIAALPDRGPITGDKANLSSAPAVINHNVLPFTTPPVLTAQKTAESTLPAGTVAEATALQQQSIPAISAEEQYVGISNSETPGKTLAARKINIRDMAVATIAIDNISTPVTQLFSEGTIEEPAVEKPASEKPAFTNGLNYPLSTESAFVISAAKTRKVSWQLFLTPTISYRKLAENKSFESTIPAGIPAAPRNDVNNEVTHKPDMGLQVGVSARYKVTKSLRLRGGLQFNINRYDIKAVAYNPELAMIELNGTNGTASTLSAWTPYRNNHKSNGFRSDWLKNFYFSVSAPIGAEMIVLGRNKKTSFGVAGTIQPTYIIKDRAYVISSNYKNYANIPSLTRHLNVNTGFETFINYTNGKTKWQVGPQVRYQVLSSFNNKYPVKENLFDFGVKIGVTLND